MDFLRKTFQKYTGALRGFKAVYVINNLLQIKKLRPNARLYRKFGLRKSVVSPLGSQDFKTHDSDIPWLDQPGGREKLVSDPTFKAFDQDTQEAILNFVDNGFLILKGFYDDTEVTRLNTEVDRLLADGKADFNYTQKKIMDAYKLSPLIDQSYFRNPELIKLLNFLMGKKVIPFQTIHFLEGSEQKAHSDSIHMTTEPLGYLIATWTALEPVGENNGPLFYYPGSHRLSYLLCPDYNSGNTTWTIGPNSYRNYESAIAALIEREGLKKSYFYAQPGDVLLWHANLLHGGDPIKKPGSTRRSMVSHYFCEEVLCYHEISQRPAII
ncbi:MAG: phytanoyl-CoA dioxygenase family protein [Saprospiraceae bacterium]|nr:phytanoyl-CoA dioxygenase family protein [Saprospiraceae bacterium]